MTAPVHDSFDHSPETLTRNQIIKLTIATAVIEAYGGDVVNRPEAIAEAVKTISKAVYEHQQ